MTEQNTDLTTILKWCSELEQSELVEVIGELCSELKQSELVEVIGELCQRFISPSELLQFMKEQGISTVKQ